MADVRRAVKHLIDAHPGRLQPGSHVTVAVSGGADSMALAWATQHVATRAGVSLDAVVVDHGLQEGSDQVAHNTVETLAQAGIPGTVVRVIVDLSVGVEQGARNARYDALRAHASHVGAEAVFLGHTADDQAETVLLGLVRGSGARSLRGMDEVNGLWWRPFLGLRRQTTRQACVDAGVPVWDDPHNDDTRFLRVRVRQRVMPLLEGELGPGVTEALVRTASLFAHDDDLLTELAETTRSTIRSDSPRELPIAPLRELHPALQARVVKSWCEEATGGALHLSHVHEIVRLVTAWHGQGPLDIPGGKVSREGDTLRVVPRSSGNEAGA